MTVRHNRQRMPNEVLQVVLDDDTVERLRVAAGTRGLEVEQLIVHALHLVSWAPDEMLRVPSEYHPPSSEL